MSHVFRRASSFGPPGGGAETFASLDQLKTFTQILVPLLMQCWVEVGPSQLNTGLPGFVDLLIC